MWAVSARALAAAETFDAEFGSIGLKVIILGLLLAFMGGAASSLLKVRKAINDGKPIKNYPLEVATDMVVSMMGGVMAFLGTEICHASSGAQLITIISVSFSGAKGVAWAQKRWIGSDFPTQT